jgi:ABC-2 type transport system ATP-binding protein
MILKDAYFQDVKQILEFGEDTQIIKRLIDLTLDTNELSAYRDMMQLIEQTEQNIDKTNKNLLYKTMFDKLINILEDKKILAGKKPVIEAKKIIKSYRNSGFTLGPVDFQLQAGEIVGLVGENGNGKTTLLRMVFGDLRLDQGEIKYNFVYDDDYDRRSHIIYIPQRTASWRGLMMEHLQFAALCYGVKGEENQLMTDLIITRMGLRKFRNYNWKELSSGYKMRFELARALLRMPKLLLIDEPLANLDILAQNTVLEDFKDIAKSPFRPLAIMLSSQQLYEVEKTSNNVLFLKEGKQKTLHSEENKENEAKTFIVEFETNVNQETLLKKFKSLNVINIQNNGGTYIGVFPESCTINDFLNIVLQSDIPLLYFRDITNSSRRFFLS